MIKGDTNLFRLDPYMGRDALIRVGGRIRRANVPRELAHRIILPDCHITRILIEFHHNKCLHSGKTTTLNEIRATGYWVLKGRTIIINV